MPKYFGFKIQLMKILNKQHRPSLDKIRPNIDEKVQKWTKLDQNGQKSNKVWTKVDQI